MLSRISSFTIGLLSGRLRPHRVLIGLMILGTLSAMPLVAGDSPTSAERGAAPPAGHDADAWVAYISEPLETDRLDLTEAQARLITAEQKLRPEVDRILHFLEAELDERGQLLLEAEHDAWELHHRARARLEASPQHASHLNPVVHGLSLVESYCRRIDQLSSWLAEARGRAAERGDGEDEGRPHDEP